MAKYYGRVLYETLVESFPGSGAMLPKIKYRYYSGDIVRNSRRYENGQWQNDNLNVANTISILADPYAYQNFHLIRAIEFMGAFWKVKSIDAQRPRLNLMIGDVFHGGPACSEWKCL